MDCIGNVIIRSTLNEEQKIQALKYMGIEDKNKEVKKNAKHKD
jgi:hypothetical protein